MIFNYEETLHWQGTAAGQSAGGDANIAKTLHFVLDTLFAGFPEVYRTIRDQLREHEGQVYGPPQL